MRAVSTLGAKHKTTNFRNAVGLEYFGEDLN
jgi:hypothetical protein